MPDRPIEGVRIVRLDPIEDHRGAVYRMLRATDPHFIRFGEIYFSTVYEGVIKGWKSHRRVTANYACIAGRIRLVLHDDREGSATRGATMELFQGPGNYRLVVIPPKVWHAFQGAASPVSILANCATEPHDPEEIDLLDPHTTSIPFKW